MCTSSVHAIILAGGSSRRMGEPKQVMDLNGKPMIGHVLSKVKKFPFEQIVVITGANEEVVRASVTTKDKRIQFLHNPKYELGQSSSLMEGLCFAKTRGDHAMVFLADQPLIHTSTIQEVFIEGRAMETSMAPFSIRPIYRGRLGHPVFFGNTHKLDLTCLSKAGDGGGKQLVSQLKSHQIEVKDSFISLDVDTPQDLEVVKQLIHEQEELLL